MLFRRSYLALFSLVATASVTLAQGKDPKISKESMLEVKGYIYSVAISPDGKTLAVGADNIHLYDLTSDDPKATKVVKSNQRALSLVFSQDNKYLAYGGFDNKVHVWSVDGEPQETSEGKGHIRDVRALAFSKDGKFLLSGSDDRSMILWNFGDGKITENTVIRNDDKTSSAVRAVGFRGPSANILVSANTGTTSVGGGTLRAWQLQKSGKYTPAESVKIPYSSDPNIALRPAGTGLAVGAGSTIHALIGNTPGLYKEHTKSVRGLAFSPDGILLASCGADGRINVWVAGTAKVKLSKERTESLTALAFTPPPTEGTHESTHLVVGSSIGKVYVYKFEPGAKK